METLYRSRWSAGKDWKQSEWLAQAIFGLFLAGLMAWLAVLYLGAPVDF